MPVIAGQEILDTHGHLLAKGPHCDRLSITLWAKGGCMMIMWIKERGNRHSYLAELVPSDVFIGHRDDRSGINALRRITNP